MVLHMQQTAVGTIYTDRNNSESLNCWNCITYVCIWFLHTYDSTTWHACTIVYTWTVTWWCTWACTHFILAIPTGTRNLYIAFTLTDLSIGGFCVEQINFSIFTAIAAIYISNEHKNTLSLRLYNVKIYSVHACMQYKSSVIHYTGIQLLPMVSVYPYSTSQVYTNKVTHSFS